MVFSAMHIQIAAFSINVKGNVDAFKTLIQKSTSSISSSNNTRDMASTRNLDVNSIFQDDPFLKANFSFAIQP